jgi:hypothetical protein
MIIRSVWYAADYPVSLVATEPLKRKQVYFNTRYPGLEDSTGKVLYETPHRHGQYLLEYHPPEGVETTSPSTSSTAYSSNTLTTTSKATSQTRKAVQFDVSAVGFQKTTDPRSASKAEAWVWHERLGHPSAEGLEQLVKNSLGIQLAGIAKDECAACSTGKAVRHVSRRSPDHWPTAPGDYIVIDFFTISKAYNNEKVVLIIGDRWSDFTWVRTLRSRKEGLLAIEHMIAFLERQYHIKVSIVRLDWETALRNAFDLWAATEGYLVQRSADYTGAQNPAERVGGIIFKITRTLRFQSRFPESLAPELVRAAVYFANRLGRKRHNWKTPEGLMNAWLNSQPWATHQRPELPQMAHLKRYGCRAYPLTQTYKSGQEKSNKTEPRAHIGYLCGYDSTNIYRIWIPSLNRVLRTRDVTFNEGVMYDPNAEDTSLLHRQELEIEFTRLDIPFPDPIQEEIPMDSALWDGQESSSLHLQKDKPAGREPNQMTPSRSSPAETQPQQQSVSAEGVETGDEVTNQDQGFQEDDISSEENRMTPVSTPEEETHETILVTEPEPAQQPQSHGRPRGSRNNNIYNRQIPIGQLNQQPDNATRSSRRLRGANSTSNFLQSTDTVKEKAQTDSSADGLGKIHRNDLPALPTNYAEAKTHKYWLKWLAAMNAEYQTVWKKGTFEAIRLSDVDQSVNKILPLKWVFTYKFDKHRHLQKFKARICVRGDLQLPNGLDTYASTLAGRSFRSLMAIVARFNLDTIQLDAVNAFTNARLDELIYVWFPPGFNKSGFCLQLHKALYGLRRSPLLWQKSLTRTLESMGLKRLQEDDCIFIGKNVAVFVFVDDIAVIHRQKHKSEAQHIVDGLKETYEMKELGELSIFLGVRIIRDRNQRKLWLCLDNYITKICDEFKIEKSKKGVETPMASDNLMPNEGQATAEEIHLYQRKDGSLNYAAIMGRPDIARTCSRLAEFMTNPSLAHHKAADQCLQYLYSTRYLAIEFNCEDNGILYCASDASFADDSVTRKSTQGYVTMLFGGPIAWKSSKQRRVVTSSTEAELVALTQATKEYLATIRLVEELQLKLDDDYIMWCDNQQTLRLLTAERPQATSKLRHININNLWLRQELQKGVLKYNWVKTNAMVADGTTKAMPGQKHALFLAQLGMTNVEEQITSLARN